MRTSRKRQGGVGMVEILVALLVLAIGVLGYAGLQLNALKSTEDANIRSQATALARDALERIIANPQARSTYLQQNSWNTGAGALGEAPPSNPDCMASSCDSDQMSVWDRNTLRWQAGNLLPAGKIRVQPCDSGSTLTSCVVVAWGDQALDGCIDGGDINTDDSAKCVVMEVTR
tara:strand:+ start:215 stop:736 length:522 start_codon:yes stop_codon:yes gene_type:complete